MPVGTGSIKRAAKANVAAGTKAEKPVAKKPAATKKAAPKKTETKTVEIAVVKSVNEVCHLTEELPIHLL